MSESTVTSVPCRVGITAGDRVWIESPRTGNRLALTRDVLAVLPRMWGRIVQKVSVGITAVPFTADELRAVKTVADAQAEHEAKKLDDPPRHFGRNRQGQSQYSYWVFKNPEKRNGGYALRPDDTFEIDCHTTDWPPFGLGLWFRHPLGPAMVVAGPDKESLPAGLAEKFNSGKSATFTGAELNVLYAACTATHRRVQPIRTRRRRFGF